MLRLWLWRWWLAPTNIQLVLLYSCLVHLWRMHCNMALCILYGEIPSLFLYCQWRNKGLWHTAVTYLLIILNCNLCCTQAEHLQMTSYPCMFAWVLWLKWLGHPCAHQTLIDCGIYFQLAANTRLYAILSAGKESSTMTKALEYRSKWNVALFFWKFHNCTVRRLFF